LYPGTTRGVPRRSGKIAEYELRSTSYEVDEGEAVEFYYDRGWSDGLPIVPPTEEKVRAMLAGAGLDAGEQIAFIETRQAAITAEKAALNAVLAGCRPEYMPVIVAALEAMARSWGVPGYRFLSLLHPIANLTEWELDQRAQEIAPKIVQIIRK
jgi:hypothetical protein